MCFLSTLDQRRLTKTGLQQPFEYGQVSINKELTRQQQELQQQKSEGIRYFGDSKQLYKS